MQNRTVFTPVYYSWPFKTTFLAEFCNLLSVYKVHTPTNVLFIKLDTVLKFTLKIILTGSYMFRSTTIIRELSLGPS